MHANQCYRFLNYVYDSSLDKLFSKKLILIIATILFLINMIGKFWPNVLPEILTWEVSTFILYLFVALVLFSAWIGIRLTAGIMTLVVIMGGIYWAMII